MANTKLIKKRIKSTQNISQITKAMQMVAASRMKKSQELALAGKPYAEKILEVVQSLAKKTDPKLHPFLRRQEKIKTYLLVLITTNKGLCGNLNTNLLRLVNNFIAEKSLKKISFDFVTLGQKGQNFILKTGGEYLADFSQLTPFTQAVAPINQIISRGYLQKKYSRVYLAFNDFINALKQEPAIKRILPITLPEKEKLPVTIKEKIEEKEILHEPSPKKILDSLLPFYIELQIRRAILEAEASEHSARMMAMKNATENALALMEGLTLEFNKARQQAITLEIADIITAKVSLEKE
jgi:F-type H+-transporting ATPase subunit gamma